MHKHRPAAMTREAVAMNLDKVDILRALGNPFFKDQLPLSGHDAGQMRGDGLWRHLACRCAMGVQQQLRRR